jgi:hypothetical protein
MPHKDNRNLVIHYHHSQKFTPSPSNIHPYAMQTTADTDFSSFEASDVNWIMDTYCMAGRVVTYSTQF